MKIGGLAVFVAIASACALGDCSRASADSGGATAAKSHESTRETTKHPFPSARKSGAPIDGASAGSGLWLGGAGFALALLGLGAAVLSSRRFSTKPGDDSTAPRVAGRVALTPRQAVHLLKIGDRTLLIGTGAQGPPSFLGEWTESTDSPPKPVEMTLAARGERGSPC